MLFEPHQAAIEAFITAAQRIPAAKAQEPRAPGKWTPCQEAAHLIRTYVGFTEAIEDGAGYAMMLPPERVAAVREKVLPKILAGDWFPSGGITPEQADPGPAPGMLAELLDQLRDAAQRFEAAVQRAEAAAPDRTVQHPYFGALTLADLVAVQAAHTLHHLKHLPDSA